MKLRRAEFLSTLATTVFTLGIAGCDTASKAEKDDDEDDKKKKKKNEDEDEDEGGDEEKSTKKSSKKDKKKGSKKKDDDEEEEDEDEDDKKSAKKDKGKKSSGKGPDLDALFGSKADGFSPLVFKKLKAGMTPAEAGKIMPGGEKPDEFGFAEIKPKDTPGVAHFKLSYQEGKLAFAEIIFEESVSTDAFWEELVAHLKKKLAPVEMKELEPGKKSVMWIGPDFNSITLAEGIIDPGFTLQYAVLD